MNAPMFPGNWKLYNFCTGSVNVETIPSLQIGEKKVKTKQNHFILFLSPGISHLLAWIIVPEDAKNVSIIVYLEK